MKIEVSGPTFARALAGAAEACGKGKVMPVHRLVRVSAFGQSVTVEATDGAVWVERTVTDDVAVLAEGETLIDPSKLLAQLRLNDGLTLEVVAATKRKSAHVVMRATGRPSEMELNECDGKWPKANSSDPPVSFSLPDLEFARMVKAVDFSAWRKDDVIVGETGKGWTVRVVCVSVKGDTARCDTSDTVRMASATHQLAVPTEFEKTVWSLVKLRAVEVVLKNIGKGGGELAVHLGERSSSFYGGTPTDSWVVRSPASEGKFPPVEVYVREAAKMPSRFSVVAGELSKSVERVMAVDDDGRFNGRLDCELSAGVLRLSSETFAGSSRTGCASDELAVAYDGESVPFAVAPEKLSDFLRSVPKEATVEVLAQKGGRVVMFVPGPGRAYCLGMLGERSKPEEQ